MHHRALSLPVFRFLVVVAVTVVPAVSCSSAPVTDDPKKTKAGDDLPCDVSAVIDAKCASCHSDPPVVGAPTSLLSFADLSAPSITDPSLTMAEESIARMQDAARPMPPGGGATDDEIAAFQAFVDSGYEKGDCSGTSHPDPAFEGESICTSGKTWPLNSYHDDISMQPGRACNQCHKAKHDGPILAFGGTVYPTGHEPDRCYGVDGSAMSDVIVEITGANGKVLDMHVTATGNFGRESTVLTKPYRAKVISANGERVMSAEQTEGDCNLCHTEQGQGDMSTAPGRIVVPAAP